MNYNPWTAGIAPQQVMPGTADPSQQQQGQFQQQLVDALRGFGGGAPHQQAGRIAPANAGGEGLNTDAIGQALGKAGSMGMDWFNSTGNFAPADLAGTSFI